MGNFGIFKGFSDKLFEGELPTQLGKIGSESFGFTGLLDDYPNAAAAYSLRLLRTAYTGSAIRVRRSSDNTEQDIGFTSAGNLDTTALTTFCGSGNGFVTTWYDQSGNARNATQTTAANQPQIVSSGNAINLNGKPSIQFDGTNDQLLTTSISWSTSFTYVGAFSAIDNNNYGKIYSIGADATSSGYAFATFAGATTMDWQVDDVLIFGKGYSLTDPRIISNGKILTDNVQNLVFTNLSSVSSNCYRNGSEISYRKRTTGNTDNASNILYIGGSDTNSQNYKGNNQEMVFYSSNQNSNRTGIESNINTYYGIY
jgi:hypothetical protein